MVLTRTSFVDMVAVSLVGSYAPGLPTGTPVSLAAGATFDVGGNNQQVASLSDYTAGSGGTVVNSNTSAASTLTLSATGGTSTFSGVIAGGGSLGTLNLVMSGSGTQVLAGSNTYTGSTTINGGVLAVNGSLNSGGNVTVNAAATLSGSGAVGNVTISASGTLAPGFNGSGTLTASSLTLNSVSILDYTLGSAADSLLAVSGALALGSSETLNVTPGGSWGSGTYVLATYGSVIDSSSGFSGWTVGGTGLGHRIYSFSLSGGSLDLIVASPPSANWMVAGGGSWSTSATGNWSGGATPHQSEDAASFGTVIGTRTATVTINGGNVSVGSLTFNTTGGGSYIIAGPNTLTFDNGDIGPAQLINNGGSHSITAPVTLNSDLAVTTAPGSSVTLSGSFSGAAALSVNGGGTMVLSGTKVQYNGNVTVTGGTLQVVNTDAGTPGAATGFSIGTASASNTLSIGPNGVLNLYADTTSVYQGDHSSGMLVNGSIGTTAGTTITGNGVLLKTGNGIFGFETNNGYAVTLAMSGGTIDIAQGMLRDGGWGGADWTNNKASLYVASGGSLDIWTGTVIVDALLGNGVVWQGYGGAYDSMTIGVNNGSGTWSGNFAANAAGILTKTGTGTEVFAAANGFDKSLVINGGNLAVNGSLANATITVTTTGAMAGTLAGAGTVGSVTVSARGTVAPGFSLGGGTLTAGSLSLSPSSVLSYTLATSTASSSNSRLSITGGLTLSTGLTLSITPATGSTWSSATSGTYVLATYGSLTNNSSSFSGWTVAANPLLGRHTYGFSVGSGSLDLTVGSAATVSGTWSGSGGGSWGTAGDWQGGNIPGYVGDTATFGTAIGSAAATVTLDGARGLSGLTLSTTGGGSYIIAGPGTLTFAGSTVTVSVSGGQHTIAAPVALASNLAVSATTGSSLTISGPISETSAGKSVTLTGSGTLILSGSNTYTGGTMVASGTLDFATPDAVPSTGIVTVSAGSEVALGALSGASSPATEASATDATETGAETSGTSTAVATTSTVGETTETLGGTDSMAEAVPAAAVPEPSTLALLGVAAIGLLAMARRIRNTK